MTIQLTYTSPYGFTKLSENVGAKITAPYSAMPSWFNRLFRPKFFAKIAAAQVAEAELLEQIKVHFEKHGTVPEWIL